MMDSSRAAVIVFLCSSPLGKGEAAAEVRAAAMADSCARRRAAATALARASASAISAAAPPSVSATDSDVAWAG